MKKIIFILLSGVLLLAAGCGAPAAQPLEQEPEKTAETASSGTVATNEGSPEASAKASSGTGIIEPSALISKAEAEKILGKTLGEGENSEQKAVGLKLCVYASEDNDMLQVSITQQALMNGGMTPLSIYEGVKEAFPNAKKADGIGDEAYIFTPGIHIMKNGYYILVSLGLLEKNEEKLISAGKLAVANLEAALKK